MTPAEVRLLRSRHRIGGADLYGASGLDAIIDRSAIEPSLIAECREIERILGYVPEFATACDYLWTTAAENYDIVSEAVFQRRLLVMLAKYWIEAPDRAGLAERLGGVVIVQEFITRFGLGSPRIRDVSPMCKILSLPVSFFEQATWLFAGLRCWTALQLGQEKDDPADGGWSIATTPVPDHAPRPFDHVTTNELIARHLAEPGRDQDLRGANAALLIREQVPALAGETGELDGNRLPFFDQNAAYMVAEFAIAHEIGHLLAGHDPADTVARDALLHEPEADRLGCLLMAMSAPTRVFGWGEDIHEAWVQAAIGLALFYVVLSIRIALAVGSTQWTGMPASGATVTNTVQRRAAGVRRHLNDLLIQVAKDGRLDDARRIAALADNADMYAQDLHQSLVAVPDDQIQLALKIAEQSIWVRG